jgi:hypothetical protein
MKQIMLLAILSISASLACSQSRLPELADDLLYEKSSIDIRYGDKTVKMKSASTRFDYQRLTRNTRYASEFMPALTMNVVSSVRYLSNKEILEHQIELSSSKKLSEDLTVLFPVGNLGDFDRVLMPLKNGTVYRGKNNGNSRIASYRCSGKQDKFERDLAIPMLICFDSKDKSVAVLTDPYFSSFYEKGFLSWCYPKEVGLEDPIEKRTILEIADVGNIDEGMDLYYQTVLKDVPPGPEWVKDIAMISYDYMSDNGRGWYNDIDTLAKITDPEDRHKIALCLHGWYDIIGRYCFDEKTGKLDEKWTNRIRGIELSISDLHHRISYAKDKGFKVLMYFADGVLSSKGLPGFIESESMGSDGWNGPDVLGGPYHRNIAYPRHYDFFRNYAKALFAEFAREVDGFVWDETFYIIAGNSGTKDKPGYLNRTQMRLIKEIAGILHTTAANKAFFTSDAIAEEGHPQNIVPPYALMSDGTYQDSHCKPGFWSFGIFPNYRNNIWSCNWGALSGFKYTVFGVEAYNTPVVFTNGWGDDRGFSEMSLKEREDFMKLFDYRKQFRTKLKYFEALPPYFDYK